MKPKIKMWILSLTITLLSITCIVWFAWPPIMARFIAKSGAGFFRDSFQSNTNHCYVCVGQEEWATTYFAGTTGLKELRQLAADQSLVPSGRDIARSVQLFIETGYQIPYIKWELSQKQFHLPWMTRRYLGYILRRDTRFLQERGIAVPEERKEN